VIAAIDRHERAALHLEVEVGNTVCLEKERDAEGAAALVGMREVTTIKSAMMWRCFKRADYLPFCFTGICREWTDHDDCVE